MLKMVRRILRFCGPEYARRIRIAYIFSFLKSLFSNVPIMIAVFLISRLYAGEANWVLCCEASGVLLICLGLGAVFQNLSDRFQSSAGYEVFAEKRLAFADHLRKLPMGYFSAGNIGRISSILSDDMVFIEENAMSIVAEVISNLFAQGILIAFLFSLHPILGTAALIVVLAALTLGIPMNRESLRNSGVRQQAIEDMTSSILEYIEGFGISRSFCLTGESAGELRNGFRKMRDADLQYEKQHAPWEKRLMILYGIGSGIILLLSIWLLQEGKLESAAFIGVLLFLFNIFVPIRSMLLLDHRMTIMDTCLNRLEVVFSETPLDLSGNEELPSDADHELEFRHVSFAYGSENVLTDVSFFADSGQMIALVGESGSGKTTIANLLARFWEVAEGEVLLRGADIRSLPMDTLMAQISMVFQKVYLFDDTIYNNIAMGRQDATYDEVVEAAKKARCYEFIMRLPYGFDTRVGEGGASLSGGEKQRISIARCILKDAPIIILDEATASVDADNEYYIQEAMSELCKDKTVLAIAHRLNTIRSADKIIVLDKGKVIEEGNHEILMEMNGQYRSSFTLQRQMNGWYSNKEATA